VLERFQELFVAVPALLGALRRFRTSALAVVRRGAPLVAGTRVAVLRPEPIAIVHFPQGNVLDLREACPTEPIVVVIFADVL
jgi:hypothetical protein